MYYHNLKYYFTTLFYYWQHVSCLYIVFLHHCSCLNFACIMWLCCTLNRLTMPYYGQILILWYLLWINWIWMKKWSPYDWVKLILCSKNIQTQFYNLIFLSKFISFLHKEFWLFKCAWNMKLQYLDTCCICFNHKVLQIKTGRKSMCY